MVKLPPLPRRIAALPKDDRGYPIPWFVQWVDGKPIFPVADYRKAVIAIQEKKCWICGEPTGKFIAFVSGPMCALNRTSAEPPSHVGCAQFAVIACPFLINPNMKRIDNEITRQGVNPAGIMIRRNPGVSMVWTCRGYRIFRDEKGGILFRLPEPEHVSFWKEARPATKEEVLDSVRTGACELEKIAAEEGHLEEYEAAKKNFLAWLEVIFP